MGTIRKRGLGAFLLAASVATASAPSHIIEVEARTKDERSWLAALGYALEEVRSDKVFIFGDKKDEARIRRAGFRAEAHTMKPEWLEPNFSIAADGAIYRTYDQVNARLQELAAQNSRFVSLVSLGKSLENRDVPLLRISSLTPGDAEAQKLPVAFYMGCHHARERLSVEIPLRFAEHLIANYGKDPNITRLVDTREIYVAPIINPDGYVYDRQSNWWRKNRRPNGGRSFGVDLNRNYAFGWGGGGASTNPDSETYRGPSAFSEIETRNVRDFVRSQKRMKILLSTHTFSELVLYPWGHTYDSIGQNGQGNAADLPVFEKMARDMAAWNHYTPQQSSDLYIASGDTTDWAYGELGIFAFTFELSPSSMGGGGFYPDPSRIEPTFSDNLKPMLYMLEFANDPHRVLTERIPDFLNSPARMGVPMASFNDLSL